MTKSRSQTQSSPRWRTCSHLTLLTHSWSRHIASPCTRVNTLWTSFRNRIRTAKVLKIHSAYTCTSRSKAKHNMSTHATDQVWRKGITNLQLEFWNRCMVKGRNGPNYSKKWRMQSIHTELKEVLERSQGFKSMIQTTLRVDSRLIQRLSSTSNRMSSSPLPHWKLSSRDRCRSTKRSSIATTSFHENAFN